jgi:hypothetical protein
VTRSADLEERSSWLDRKRALLVQEFGDPNAPLPEEVALERLSILARNLVLVVLVVVTALISEASALAMIADGLMLITAIGAWLAKPARGRLVRSCRMAVWSVMLTDLVGNIIVRWFVSPRGSSTKSIFGVAAGPIAHSVVAGIIPVMVVATMVVTIVMEAKIIITEVRSIRSREDTYKLIAEMGRLRRGRRV